MKDVLKILFISSIFVLGASCALAQSNLPFGLQETLETQISPSSPEPNQIVKIKVSSYLTDLTQATVSWYVDGTLVEQGVGVRNIEFLTGKAGSTSTIKISIRDTSGKVTEKTLKIIPSEVDLLLEAKTSVPPFYKGRALATHQSSYKFVAISNLTSSSGQKISNDKIYYKWKINGLVELDGSGVGKNTYQYVGGIISKPIEVVVEAASINSDQTATKMKTFTPIEPSTIFYENDPVLGLLFNNALTDSFNLTKQEVEITAVPLFFDVYAADKLKFIWNVDDSVVENAVDNFLSLRRTDGKKGTANINVKIESDKNILQGASSYLEVDYQENESFNF